MSKLSDRLTFANVVSVVALFVALGGGAYAISLKKNSVKSKHIKDGQVKTRDLGNGAVTGAKVANGSLSGADVGPDSLTGTQIDEGTLGQVPSAAQVDGLNAAALEYRVNAGAADKTFALSGGLQVVASCSAAGALSVTAISGKNNSAINQDVEFAGDTHSYSGDPDFDTTADAFTIVNALENGSAATLTYVSPATGADAGSVTTITYHAREDVFGAPDAKDCVFAGTALGGEF